MSSSRLRKLLLPLLRAVKEGRPITFKMRSCASQGLFLIEKPVSLKSKAGRLRRKSEKQSARASQQEEDRDLRAEVFRRAGGCCELGCGGTLAVELHHLEGGSGRTALQAVSNCVAACWACHRAFHSSPESFRLDVLNWAAAYGYPVPRRYRGPPKLVAAGAAQPPEEVSKELK